VQDALAIVIVAVVVVAGLVGVATLLASGGAYDHIGRSEITFDHEADLADEDSTLEADVRAFVEARNARRLARGEPGLDVEEEVKRRLSGQDG
jgi:hypothetical protein